MYAIIEDSGTQIKITPGEIVDVDLRRGDTPETGGTIDFDRVLMIGDVLDDAPARVGTPYVDGASVSAEVLGEIKGEKLVVFKYKRRKHYRRTRGHRQSLTTLRIEEVRA